MTKAPPLEEGEEVVFDHIPSQRAFKRAALFLILISILPTIAFAFAFKDSFWVIAPMFITCMLLMQERFTLGRYRAWITNRRVIFQDGRSIARKDIVDAKMKGNAVRLTLRERGKADKLSYPDSPTALIAVLDANHGGDRK